MDTRERERHLIEKALAVLRNARIAGLSVYRGEVMHGEHSEPVLLAGKPILERETWQAVEGIPSMSTSSGASSSG